MIRAGLHRHKVTIEEPTQTTDSVGEPIITWLTYASRSAKISYSGSREVYRFQQYISETDSVFTFRYDGKTKNITTKMRLSYNSRVYNIKGIVNYNEMNKEVIVACVEDT